MDEAEVDHDLTEILLRKVIHFESIVQNTLVKESSKGLVIGKLTITEVIVLLQLDNTCSGCLFRAGL